VCLWLRWLLIRWEHRLKLRIDHLHPRLCSRLRLKLVCQNPS